MRLQLKRQKSQKNPILCQNFKSTCKNMSTSAVVASTKYRKREKKRAARNFLRNDKFNLMLNFDLF